MKPPQLGFGFAPEGVSRKQRRAQKAKARYQANPEKFRARSLAWQKSQKGKAYKKAWKAANRDRNEAARRAKRAAWKAAGLCSGCGGVRECHFNKCRKCLDHALDSIAKRHEYHVTKKRENERVRRAQLRLLNPRPQKQPSLDYRAKRAFRLAHNLCTECGSARDPAQKMCAACQARSVENGRRWRIAHAEKMKEYQRRSNYKRNYGISSEDVDARLVAQGGRCDICGGDKPGTKGWQVDHCHDTGKVRAILCGPCNLGLGCFKDNPEFLAKALEYLRKHRLTLVV